MGIRILTMAGVLAFAASTASAQATMNELRLTEGETDINRLTAPVYDAANVALAIGAFTGSYDKKQLFVRRGGGNMFTRGPEYRLNQAIDVAALFAESLRTQATAMGLRVAGDGASGWRLSGAIRDVFIESRQVPYGATLFYGYLQTDVQLDGPDGAKHTATLRLHNYCGRYNAGMGRRDEAETCAAQLLVEGAQELLARLNRAHLHAAPHPALAAKLAGVESAPADPQRPAIRAIGLSSLETATPAFLKRLPNEQSESGRAAIVDALAILGAASAVAPLAARYALEDEDPRWYTLKAMDYIGGDEAMKLVSTAGVNDPDTGPKRLAQRIVKK
ncbi:MAG TPA: hypothetical protein VES67_06815 [Vicinamibacterales bacterium]|nr:hypothetical protein [Vicinamibacterales bacterium]